MSSPGQSGADRDMQAESKYILMIFRDGVIRYATSKHGRFKPAHCCQPYKFPNMESAMICFEEWSIQKPADRRDWMMRILEAEEQ